MKKDFPIFKNNPWLIFFDSTASSQKPSYVINWIKNYLENDYSNIHRWMYDIAIRSEKLYISSKKKTCEVIWWYSYKEIIYTYNSTYALNLLSWSLKKSNYLKKWDKVLLTIVEHHANIVPWLILKEEIWIEVEFVWLDENFDLDMDEFNLKYDSNVKVISFTHVSNVTWKIFDLEKIWILKRKDTIFIVDGSQSVPHMKVDVNKMNCDALFFTWHKVMADSWIWVLWWKEELLNNLDPVFSWGWAISNVTCSSYESSWLPDKFEPWTPNVSWAVSLLKAFEYIDSIWWYNVIESKEKELTVYFLEKFNKYKKLKLIWSKDNENRVWVFTFVVEGIHSDDFAYILAEKWIAIRSWKHCAHPLLSKYWLNHSVRVSLYIYNTIEEIDKLFELIDEIVI